MEIWGEKYAAITLNSASQGEVQVAESTKPVEVKMQVYLNTGKTQSWPQSVDKALEWVDELLGEFYD